MPMTEAIPIEGGPVDGRLREESFSEVIDVEDSKYAASPPTGQSFITIASTGTEQINRGRKICSLPDIAMLPGETVCSTVRSIVHGAVYFTNYRIVFMLEDRTGIAIIPRIAVEYVQLESDEASITVACRNGRMFRISASNVDSARAIHTQLLNVTMEERSAGSLFAFQVAQNVTDSAPAWLKGEPTIGMTLEELQSEFQRLQFGDYWKITDANGQFAMIPTYPEHFIIPKSVPDISLLSAASGRFLGRIPVAVWRDVKSGATLFRSSQPYVPWIGSSNPDEINLYNKCRESTSDATMIIMDARSSTSAHANRMKGGGFEFPQNYFGSDVKFMNLPNIHAVRNGFASYRQTISTKELDLNFYLNIHNCSWLYQIYSIISAAKHCNEYLTSGKNVLVHCSDGWDRTTQIVALAKLL
uniref:Protein-tyrosine-phosphatase n=1 Tax=Steinernema glaseri TaxID=37863 RepID=A0A1I7Y0V1_9BILA